MSKAKREAYFKLAELLAVLSGALFIAAGIFASYSTTSLLAMQNNNALINNVNNTLVQSFAIQSNSALANMQKISYLYMAGIFMTGFLLVLTAFWFWFKGYKENPEQ